MDHLLTETLAEGRFRIEGVLGEGATGVVYRAWDSVLGGVVALKMLHSADASEAYHLKREFRELAEIVHPNLVQRYELFVSDGSCFFTMELLDGRDFLAWVRHAEVGGAPPVASVLSRLRQVVPQLVTGLQALHAAGHAHRDIKPSNVLVTLDGRLVLLDFGFASALRDIGHSRFDEGFFGTPAYAAPEQIWSDHSDESADWYGVGVMLFEALTGRLPYEGSLMSMFVAKRSQGARRPSTLDPSIPSELDDLVGRLLEPAPERRAGPRELASLFGGGLPAFEALPRLPQPLGLVGRQSELALLEKELQASSQGKATIVELRGASGIGKSELARRFVRAAVRYESAVVFAGRCHPQESIPFKALDPLIDDLSHWLSSLPVDEVVSLSSGVSAAALLRVFPVLCRVPTLAERSRTETVPADPLEVRADAIAALRCILRKLSRSRRVLLWIDDAHWGDRDSVLLLRDLLRPPDSAAILLLISYRPEQALESEFIAGLEALPCGSELRRTAIDLGPLAPREAESLAEEMLRRAPGRNIRLSRAIATEAAGSPFFIGEMVRYLALAPPGGAAASSPSIADVTRARLDRLDSGARGVLELVAVAGSAVDTSLILAISGIGSEGWPLLFKLCTLCLLREGPARGGRPDRIEIYHDRVRAAVLQVLAPARKRHLHREIAEGLSALPAPDPEALMRHFLGAGDASRASEQALEASRRATSILAFDHAAELLETAIRLRGDRDEDWRLLSQRGAALGSAGRGAEAGRVYEEAAARAERLALDAETTAELRSSAAEQYLYAGLLVEGMRVLQGVLKDLGIPAPSHPREAMRAALRLRLRFLFRGHGAPRRARRPASRREIVRLDALWKAGRGTVMLDHRLADVLATRHLLGAFRLGEPSRIVRSLAMEAAAEANVGGRWLRRRSERLLDEAERLSRETALPYDEAVVLLHRGVVAMFSARFREGLEFCERAHEIFRAQCVGAAWELAIVESFLVPALANLGRLRDVCVRVERLIAQAETRGDRYSMAYFRSGDLVVGTLSRDDPEGAIAAAEATLEGIPNQHFTSIHFASLVATVRAELYLGRGDEAWSRVQRAWAPLAEAGFLQLDGIGVLLQYLRGCAALSAAATSSAAGLLEEAGRALLRIERSRLPFAPAFAAALRAGIHALRGERGGRVEALEFAVAGFDRVDMALHREAARLLLGQIAESERADAASREAISWMEAEEVRRPLHLARAVLPGPFLGEGRCPGQPGPRPSFA